MDEIPSESRTALAPLLSIVRGTRSRNSSNKELRTLYTRQQHFIKFLNKSKLGNDPTIFKYSQNVRNIIMACYTADLVAGQNILCKSLKSTTITRYLKAAADLSIRSDITNPCLNTNGKVSEHIKSIINEVKRWESMPDRREPMTKQIIEYIYNKGIAQKKINPYNIHSAIADWFILGLQSGFRRKEWAQDRTYMKKHKDIQRNPDGTPAAFILQDMEFTKKNNVRINQNSEKEINNADMVNIKWRFQKNNDNGQIISYVQDKINKKFCYVSACKRIRKRCIDLKHDLNKPIAIFKENMKSKKISYIDDVHISTILQEAAKKVHNITKKDDLKKFTSHSIRVGACVLLHSQNSCTEDIKFRLRWRSDSFRMYLRNTNQLAERHKTAVANNI